MGGLQTGKVMEVDESQLIDMKELCRQTSLSKHWFYEMISEKRLPFGVYRFGRAVRFKRAEVKTWIEARRAKN